jgi:subtilisin family serine protease
LETDVTTIATPRFAHLNQLSNIANRTHQVSLEEEISAQLSDRELVPGEILFRLKSDEQLSADHGLQVVESYQFTPEQEPHSAETPIVRAMLPEGVSVAQGLAALRLDPNIDWAEANAILELEEVRETPSTEFEPVGEHSQPQQPNDLDRRLWGLHNTGRRGGKPGADISALEAWQLSTGRRKNGPVIAVIDTGIDYKHPELNANMWVNKGEIPGDGVDNDGNGVIDDVHGYNAFADNGNPMDDHSHGTHCAGTIGAVGNNGRGIAGINWEANLMAVKIFDKLGRTSIDAILRGLQYAARMGADITNNSWGDVHPSSALKAAFAAMPSAVHFAAAGNERNNNDHRNYYPVGHDLPNMVGVAASDRLDRKPVFSNYGKKTVELAAPGDQILSTVIGGSYGIYSGTSMACPHAAGVAGLILSEFPDATPAEVRDRLLYNSDPVPGLSASSQSGGRINAFKALELDRTGPAAPADFSVREANSKGVTLSWTTTGDDGWCGGAPSDFELWVSEQPINSDNLHEATSLSVERPTETGVVVNYHYPIEQSQNNRNLHFAFRVVDNVGHRSGLQTASAQIPAAKAVYAAKFGPNDGFAGQDDWARIAHEGKWVWTDSPEGNYKNGADSSLTSPLISLREHSRALLEISAKHDLWKQDKATVEVSSDGENWKGLGSYHGKRPQWGSRSFDLADYDGQDIRIRIRLQSDTRYAKDGITIEGLRIIAE